MRKRENVSIINYINHLLCLTKTKIKKQKQIKSRYLQQQELKQQNRTSEHI